MAFTAGLVLAWTTPAVVVALALEYPGRSAGTFRPLVAAGFAVAVGLLGLLPALAFDPVRTGCGLCTANLVSLGDDARLELRLAQIGIVATLVWAVIVIAAIALRLVRAARALRAVTAPVLVPAAVLLACFAAELVLSLRRGFIGTGDVDRILWAAQQAALVGLAAGVVARSVRARRARTRLTRDIVELADPARRADVAARLGGALGDATLAIAYPVGDPLRWVDAAGMSVALRPGPGRQVTPLRADPAAQPAAVAMHRDGLLDDPVLVHEIVRSAGLALGNERLRADARARLAELQASRARIVEAADLERRRIERDLHDGAQQRIVALAVSLRAAAPDGGPEAALIDGALTELGGALDELRLIAHGIFPAILEHAGLAVAIEALAETAPVPVRLDGFCDARFAPAVEAAAYFVVAECARAPAASDLAVRCEVSGDDLVVGVVTAGSLPDPVRLSDRVGSLGGTVRSRRLPDGRAALEAVIPCAS